MEVSVLKATGAPPKALIAISSGSVRRTSDLTIGGEPMMIPIEATDGGSKISVSILKHLGSAMMPGDLPDKDVFSVPITDADGKAVKLQARRSNAPDPPQEAAPAKEPWHYLGYQEIQTVVQTLFDDVLTHRPQEPFSFMAERLRALKKSGTLGKAEAAAEPAPALHKSGAAGSLFEGRASKTDIRADSDVLKSFACDAIMTASAGTEVAAPVGAAPKAGERTEEEDCGPALEDKQVSKIHSAIRWNKPKEEIEAAVKDVGASMAAAVRSVDSKNGNQCLHIASQNGHRDLVVFLLEQKANVNAQNFKGQTPLHMSIEYDFYFQSKILLDAGANPEKENGDGHKAMLGIDGGKSGSDAWDNPVTILKAAGDDKEELESAFAALEQATADSIDKGALVQTGMSKKKTHTKHWDAARFKTIMQKF